MSIVPWLKTMSEKIFNSQSNNTGKMLYVTGAVGWVLSSVAQIFALGLNKKKISKEEKHFLIPQEIADAVVNFTMFCVITDRLTRCGNKLVSGCKLMNPTIKKFMEANKGELMNKIGTKQLYLEKNKKTGEEIAKEMKFSIENENAFKLDEKFQDEYFKFKDGMSFAFGTLGAILSCNIVTPYMRNIIGAEFQKMMKKSDIKRPVNPAPSPVLPMYSNVTMANYQNKTGVARITPASSSLKI